MAKEGQYASDRYITPGVIMAALIVGGVVVAVTVAGVAYLTSRGINADPMLKLVGVLVGAATSLGTFVLTLVGRVTAAKTERNTGQLAAGVTAVAQTIDSRLAAAVPAPAEPGTAAALTPPAGYGLVPTRTNGASR